MDNIGYHIFINLLVSHKKENDFVEYRQFLLIFGLNRTAILIK